MHRLTWLDVVIAVLVSTLPAPAVCAQTAAPPTRPDSGGFERQDAMIPMRDGVRLETVIYRPRGHAEALPILISRTPYGVGGEDRGALRRGLSDMARDGYIFVYQSVRGRYKSEGRFIMDHPLVNHRDRRATDESTDTWDTIDWLVKHVPNSVPRVGIFGVSYDGWLAAMALIDPHPALQAASPQAVMADLWMGDDDFHQGAFRETIGVEFESWMQLSNDMSRRFEIPEFDTYGWYLRAGTLDSMTSLLRGTVPTFLEFIRHPAYDTFWVNRSLPRQIDSVGGTRVPTLIVGGWWDQENLYGALATYEAIERHDTAGRNFLVMGPWYHGSWWNTSARKLGAVDFGVETADRFREIHEQWFGHWLKDRPMKLPEATLFDGGALRWRSFERWMPREAAIRRLYFQPNGLLSFTAPAASGGGSDAFISDPAHPVPYRHRPIEETYSPRGSGWYTWLSEDQRFVDDRPDVLTWRTPPLDSAVTITGDVIGHLFASTTGTDADWVVKLIDVYPDTMRDTKMNGYELMVSADIMRGRYRQSNSMPHATVPNRVAEYLVDMEQQTYTFRRGHRIMVQVQSTWFPLYDRNPQTFVPNIFHAKPGDFRAATHRIWRTPGQASHVEVRVLPEASEGGLSLRLDYAGAEAMVAALERSALGEADVDSLLTIKGVRAMVDNVTRFVPTVGEAEFRKDIRDFVRTKQRGELDRYFQLDAVWDARERIRSLIAEIRRNEAGISRRIEADLHPYALPTGPLDVSAHFSAGGVSGGWVPDNTRELAYYVNLARSQDIEGELLNIEHETYHVMQKAAFRSAPGMSAYADSAEQMGAIQRVLLLTLMEGTANVAADPLRSTAQGAGVAEARERYQRNLAPARSRENFALFDSVLAQLRTNRITFDSANHVGLSRDNDDRFYFVGYEMATAIAKYCGAGCIGTLFERSPVEFFRRYIRLYREHAEIRGRFSRETESLLGVPPA